MFENHKTDLQTVKGGNAVAVGAVTAGRACNSVQFGEAFEGEHCVKSLEHDVRNEGRMSYSGTNYDEITRVSCLRHNNSSNVRLRQQYRENMVRKVV